MLQTGNQVLKLLQSQKGMKFTNSPSPFTIWLDPTLLEVAEGEITFEYEVRHDMTNPIKTLHGGAIAGIMDDCIGAAVYSLGLKDLFTTVNLNVDYFAPAIEGNIIIAYAQVIKKGRQIVHVICELSLKSNNKVLARGSSNLIKLERKMTI
jgi:uncharacterized protein (TIGR00369 family)